MELMGFDPTPICYIRGVTARARKRLTLAGMQPKNGLVVFFVCCSTGRDGWGKRMGEMASSSRAAGRTAPPPHAEYANDNQNGSTGPRAARSPSDAPLRAHGVGQRLFLLAFVAALAAALAFGWWRRDEGYLTPKSGLGYWLGVMGAAAMLLLLLYPLSKRLRFRWGVAKARLWFRLHMLLGLLGPSLILLHSNFEISNWARSTATPLFSRC
jgi:hypothetical protein